MASDHKTIDSLPNEILISILSSLPTPQLLPLASVSRRFHALVVRVLHTRLSRAASAEEGREMILECYHPSAKLSTPYLYCNRLGTFPLGSSSSSSSPPSSTTGGGSPPEDFFDAVAAPDARSLSQLWGLYSRFRPVVQEENRSPRRRHPRRSQQQAAAAAAASSVEAGVEEEEEPATVDVHLDADESFSQLCTVTNMVRMGPRRGVFRSHVNVSDGLVRLRRAWLTDAAAARDGGRGEEDEDARILWADAGRHVGLRFRVVQTTAADALPVLVGADEDLPVSYRLEYEELLVRTSQLLLMAEKSDEQELEISSSGSSSGTSTPPVFLLDGGGVLPQAAHTLFSTASPMFLARMQEGLHYDRLQWMDVPLGMAATA